MTSATCVDASFVIKLLVPEANSERADGLWRQWLADGVLIYAPILLAYEVTSVLRKRVQRGLVSPERGREAVETFAALSQHLELIPPDLLHLRAWELASEHHQPNLYDAYYVALAEYLACRLWTADDRLRRAMPGLAATIAPLGGMG